ncbi:hypothetical protein [Methylocystis silviterrae]|uniref:hypothetical protein n=1 Tax=Methylocystis silviterrae TaxID=2743612 RepID=UPI001E4BDF05|nr:hypothetical protein [Methylocystis silviterrae]
MAWALAFSLVATISGIHHVNERVDRAQWPIYDAGFIFWGAAIVAGQFSASARFEAGDGAAGGLSRASSVWRFALAAAIW